MHHAPVIFSIHTATLRGRKALTTISNAIRRRWNSWNLARQFGIGASLVMLPAMIVTGLWVADRIERGVTSSAAVSAALYLETFVDPLVQELGAGDTISDGNMIDLSHLLTATSLGNKVVSLKIWKAGNTIVFSSRGELIGKTFPASSSLSAAWQGQVSSEFNNLHGQENLAEQQIGVPLIEIYMPVRERGSGRIIAVAEFYENAQNLQRELLRSHLLSWLVVAAVGSTMLASLLHIVRRGSRTIEQQQVSLEQRVGELTRLLSENRRLRTRAQLASARASETNEIFLRRLGADLHDGPAQLISLALLRLDTEPPATHRAVHSNVQTVLVDALKDIRNIAAGLAVPEIDTLSLEDALRSAVKRHEQLTGTSVSVRFDQMVATPHAIKLCAYRFVQEGLSNAFRHAAGAGQTVSATCVSDAVTIELSDSGPGFDPATDGRSHSLGLRSLTDRIESLAGTFRLDSSPGKGTRLVAQIPFNHGSSADV